MWTKFYYVRVVSDRPNRFRYFGVDEPVGRDAADVYVSDKYAGAVVTVSLTLSGQRILVND